ncbi:MAG: hypothetical protein LH660_02550 [Phormidesmis sp. CAN_BIN36]|nr:hypothetical protein [Phormidesmis sp. CAN_BIN36]
MGKSSHSRKTNWIKEQRQLGVERGRVQELRWQIETDLCKAVQQGYLSSEGVFLAYRQEHLPELPEAVELYRRENPEDSIQYLGLDAEDGKYTVQIAPSLKWLFRNRNFIPKLTFERIGTTPDPIPD